MAQVEGATWEEVTGDTAGAAEARALGAAFPTPGHFSRRTHHRRAGGPRFPVEVTMAPIEGESEGRWLVVVVDRSEDQVSELSTAAMRLAADAANLPVLFLTDSGRILYASAAVSWVCGRPPESLVAKTSIEIVAPGDEVHWVGGLRRAAAGASWKGEVRVSQDGGGTRRVGVHMSPVFSTGDDRPSFVVALLEPRTADTADGTGRRGKGGRPFRSRP
jgi:PAS domain-containing protein